MNLTITQDNTRTEIFGNEGSSLAHKLYEIASDQNNTVSLTGSVSVPYAYADEVEYLNTNFGPKFNITAGGTWIRFYHQEIEDAIMSWASQNPGSVGSNFASSGHITQDDADSLTQWGKTFTGNTNITQFNEFEKFRNVTQVSQNDCFQGCTNLQSIKLPPRLTYIRGWMFNGCSSLSGVVLPASCTTIDTSGFEGCTSLTSIDLSNVTTLGNYAFKNSGITGVLDLPNLTSLGRASFYGTGITSVVIPDSVTSLDSQIFMNSTRLTTVTIGNNVPAIQGETFYGCSSLTTVNIGNSVTTINGDNTFRYCDQLTTVNLPEGLTTIGGGWIFRGCNNLTSIHLPSTLTSIGENAFALCGLTNITIPATVTSIGNNCFGQDGKNTSFLSITFEGTTPPTVLGNDGLGAIWLWQAQNPTASPGRKIYVPYGCKATYVADSYFSTLANIIEELPQS